MGRFGNDAFVGAANPRRRRGGPLAQKMLFRLSR
jgi:hypothetical protein